MKNIENLTTREEEVLKLIVKGCSNPKISSILKISTSTAKAHVKNIMVKFNVSNRVELVVKVIKKYPEIIE